MEASTEWKRGIVVDKYPQDSFTAVLEEVKVSKSQKGGARLDLVFDTEQEVGIYLDRVDTATGKIDGLSGIGKLLKSLDALKVALDFAVAGDFITGARFEPDIVGETVSMVAEKRTWNKQDGTAKILVDWTVGSVGAIEAPKDRATGKTSSHPPDASSKDLTGEWKVLLAENLDAGVTYDEGGVVKLLGTWVPDKTRKAALNKARSTAFKTLFAEGFLKGSLSGFTLG